jgi:CheY-like chemotaxis protein
MAREVDDVAHKKNFVKVFVHELRNLVGTMRNSVHLIKMRRTNDAAIDGALQTIDRQISKMMQLIETVIDTDCVYSDDAILQSQLISRPAQKPMSNLKDSVDAYDSVADGLRKILIVDDNPIFCTTFTEILIELGYQVQDVRDGQEALASAEQLRPDCVFIDINIPPPNGYEVARRLREKFGNEMKLVMLSGMTFTDAMIRNAQQAGFDHYLDKTSDPTILVEWLGRSATVLEGK